MPEHLVQRINASLAAEQAQRATTLAGAPVIPLHSGPRPASRQRRPARLLFGLAGAAAAVALLAVVGTNLLTVHQPATISGSASLVHSSSAQAKGGVPPSNADPARTAATAPSLVQISASRTRYTRADFVTQAQLLRITLVPTRSHLADSSSPGLAGTATGLIECLSAIGAGDAQVVSADVAFYDGRPAVIIVATTHGNPIAYAVGRQCSHADAAVLRAATPLP